MLTHSNWKGSRFSREKTNETPHLLQAGVSNSEAKLIAQINKHKPELSALGILPNQLRTLLKGSSHADHAEEALADLRQTMFWKGFKLWKKRTALVAQFWKECPQEWKSTKQTTNTQQCLNMFHFCTKIKDLSKQKLTLCPCSKIAPTDKRLGASKKRKKDSTITSLPGSRQIDLFFTREDDVRRDRDRDKRYGAF